MSRDSLLDFYREIVNSEKSFGIDYKNLSKQLIERIDKAIEYFKYQLDNLDFYEDTKAKMLCAMGITLLQEGDKENE